MMWMVFFWMFTHETEHDTPQETDGSDFVGTFSAVEEQKQFI